jgi:hypothetical protein
MYKIQIKENDDSWADYETDFPSEDSAYNELNLLEEGCSHDGWCEQFRVVPQ